MEEPPVRKYLIYAILVSVIIILAAILYQHLVIFNRTTTMDISKGLIDFTILNYTYEKGRYFIYLVPTAGVTIINLTVNGEEFDEFFGTLNKDSPITLEGSSSGELNVRVRYITTGLEHLGYAVIPEK